MKHIVSLAPPTDSHHDDRAPVIHPTGPQDLESAERASPRVDATAPVSRVVGQIPRYAPRKPTDIIDRLDIHNSETGMV
jgi:hypothetical protein